MRNVGGVLLFIVGVILGFGICIAIDHSHPGSPQAPVTGDLPFKLNAAAAANCDLTDVAKVCENTFPDDFLPGAAPAPTTAARPVPEATRTPFDGTGPIPMAATTGGDFDKDTNDQTTPSPVPMTQGEEKKYHVVTLYAQDGQHMQSIWLLGKYWIYTCKFIEGDLCDRKGDYHPVHPLP